MDFSPSPLGSSSASGKDQGSMLRAMHAPSVKDSTRGDGKPLLGCRAKGPVSPPVRGACTRLVLGSGAVGDGHAVLPTVAGVAHALVAESRAVDDGTPGLGA